MKLDVPVSSDGAAAARSSGLFFGRILTIRHFLTRRRLGFAVVVALIATGVLAARGHGSVETPPPEPVTRALPTAVAQPEAASSYERVRRFTGEVTARRRTVLGFELPGRVTTMHVDEGHAVVADAPIAELDLAALRADRKGIEAQRREAAAVLAEMRAGPRTQTIAAARNRMRDLEARVDLLTRKQARRAKLLADRHVSREEFDEAASALSSTQALLDASRDVLAELEAGTRKEKVQAQEARLEALDAQLARIDVDLEKGVLRAPFAGRVELRHIDEGGVLGAGVPVVTLVESGHLEARVGVAPEVVSTLVAGQTYAIRVADRMFEATFRRALPATDVSTRSRTVILDLPAGSDAYVVPGELAELTTRESIAVEGVWIRGDALVKGVRGLWSAYAVTGEGRDAVVSSHHVEVLHVEGERALVRGTLEATDLVLFGDTSRVVPGQHIDPQLITDQR